MPEVMGAVGLDRGSFECHRKSIIIWLLFLIPLIGYSAVILKYAANVPFQDDYDAILYFLSHFIEARTLQEKLALLFSQHNEHRIVFDRIVSLCCYSLFGEANFKYLIVFGNLGWVLSVLILVAYAHKSFGLALSSLLPIPYILLSFGHWENMFFAMAAIQNYWFMFFAIVFLIGLSKNKILLCCAVFPATIFTSGGGVIFYLIGNAYFLMARKWKSSILFFVLSSVCMTIYFYGYHKPPYHPSVTEAILNPLRTIEYFLIYWGNIILWPQKQLYIIVGLILCVSSIYLAIKRYGDVFLQLLICFITLIALMAALTRSGFGIWQAAASRYALFPLLALVSVYIFVITSSRFSISVQRVILVGAAVVAMSFWLANIFIVEYNHYFMKMKDERVASIVEFDKGQQGSLLYPEQERARQILSTARQMHIYEY